MSKRKNSRRHNNVLLMIMRIAVVILIFILLIYLGMFNLTKLQKMIFSLWVIPALICFLTSMIVLTYRWQILLNAVNIKPGIRTLMRLTFIGYSFNTVIPGGVGGDLIKSYYVIKWQNNNRTASVTTIVLDRVLGIYTMFLTAAIAVGGTLLLMTHFNENIGQTGILLSLGYIVISLASLMFIGFMLCLNERIQNSKLAKWVTTHSPGHRLINKVYSTVYSFRERKGALVKAIMISFLAQLSLIVGMYCIGQAAEETVLLFKHFLFLAPVALILNAIPIGPGGIGSGEALVEWLFMLFGSNNGSEVMAVLHIAFIFFSGIGFTLYIRGKSEFAQIRK